MAILPILHYPDPRLRQVSAPVTVFNDALAQNDVCPDVGAEFLSVFYLDAWHTIRRT